MDRVLGEGVFCISPTVESWEGVAVSYERGTPVLQVVSLDEVAGLPTGVPPS